MSPSVGADPADLEGGVFIAHHPGSFQYSPGLDWCEEYGELYSISSCESQNPRIDLDGNLGERSLWYVIAAWTESKTWCGTEFGFGTYDPAIYEFLEYGGCIPNDLSISTDGWPGPNEGTAVTATDVQWDGNFQAVYYFMGYAYYEGQIPLDVDPDPSFGGFGNCATPSETWVAADYGAMGLFQDGVAVCPAGGGLDGEERDEDDGDAFTRYDLGGDGIDVTVLESDDERVVLDVAVGSFVAERVVIRGVPHYVPRLKGEGSLRPAGHPDVPYISRSIVLPNSEEVRVEVLEEEYVEFPNMPVAPSRGLFSTDEREDDTPYLFGDPYRGEDAYPGDLVTMSLPFVIRGIDGSTLRANVMHYLPAGNTLRVYTRQKIAISAVGARYDRGADAESLTPSFESILDATFINFEQERYAYSPYRGGLLVIVPDQYEVWVWPLVEWKRMSGLQTRVLTLSDIGPDPDTTAIKQAIADDYAEFGTDHVLLVGDVDTMPTFHVWCDHPTNWEQDHARASDYVYGLMDGEEDTWLDVIIGRLSAETIEDLSTQVDRVVWYERDIEVGASSEWLEHSLVITRADHEYKMEETAVLLEGGGYTVERVYESQGDGEEELKAVLNEGQGHVHHAGHGGLSRWYLWGDGGIDAFDTREVQALQNHYALPFISSYSCNVGAFESVVPCLAEAFLRAHDADGPKGAMGCWMSAGLLHAVIKDGIMFAVEAMLDREQETLGGLWVAAGNEYKARYGAEYCRHEILAMQNIFGDPSLRFRATMPIPLSVVHAGVMGIGQTTYEVTVQGIEEVQCTVYDDYYDCILGTARTDPDGHATIVLDRFPEIVSELTLTACARDAETACLPIVVGEPTYIVRPNGSGDFPTIQEAIDAASDGDVIGLVCGTYCGPGNRDLVMGGKSIILRNVDSCPIQDCRIDCEGTESFPRTGFYFVDGEGPETMLEGFTITGGHSAEYVDGGETIPGRGGAIVCGEPNEGSPCVSPSIVRCIFDGNSAEGYGGAIYSGRNGCPIVRDCGFQGNWAHSGGGVYHEGDEQCSLSGCVFTDNYATGHGAAVACTNGILEFCTIAWNESQDGASGVDCGAVSLKRCTIANNWSNAPGAGVLHAREGLLAQEWEGVIIAENDRVFTDTCEYPPTFMCSTIHGNTFGDWTPEIADQVDVDGNLWAKPFFCPDPYNAYPVQEGSPCLPGVPANQGCGLIGAWYEGCNTVDVTDPIRSNQNLALRIEPNPAVAGAGTQISYVIGGRPTAGGIGLRAYDVEGRCVWEWGSPDARERSGSVHWRGVDMDGRTVRSGAYFLQLSIGNEIIKQRVVFIR